ncbi:hypothetical protein PybrP1_001817 [[Pythium] brassicae (nom. inval.)]|nr:hypothetical protein PybrP1_001817 [[Pythium] brassicae (nom. inval.)]
MSPEVAVVASAAASSATVSCCVSWRCTILPVAASRVTVVNSSFSALGTVVSMVLPITLTASLSAASTDSISSYSFLSRLLAAPLFAPIAVAFQPP